MVVVDEPLPPEVGAGVGVAVTAAPEAGVAVTADQPLATRMNVDMIYPVCP